MEYNKQFLGKYCKLEKKPDRFVLYGYVKQVNEQGIVFETDQSTSFIAWDYIFELLPLKKRW